MISFRYHIVSLCAVVLALALGVVLGASSLSQTMLGALSTDRDDLSGQVSTLTAERDAARAQQSAADRVLAGTAPALVGGALRDRTVVLVAAPDAQQADLDALTGLVGQAGGRVTGTLSLTDAMLAPDRADALRSLVTRVLPAGVQLPSTTDVGTLTGSLLGALVTVGRGPSSSPAETGTAFTALADGGFLAPGAAPGPAQLALVVAGDGAPRSSTTPDGSQTPAPDAAGRAATFAHLAAGIHAGGAGTVLAARTADGAVGAVRNDQALRGVSTVDGVGATAGRLAAVLAAAEQAAGRSGAYGSGPGVAPLPQRAPAA